MTTTTQTQPEGTYWHFLNEDRRLRYSDGREVTVGETLKVEGEIELCQRGLHASKQAMDALKYAPGSVVCLVTLGGEVIHGDDKSVAGERTVLWIFDATRLLREFACTIAETLLLAEREAGREPNSASLAAIEVAKRYAKGEATEQERYAAHNNACSASADSEDRMAFNDAARAAASAAIYGTDREATYAAYCTAEWAAKKGTDSAAREQQNEMLTSLLMHEYEKETTK